MQKIKAYKMKETIVNLQIFGGLILAIISLVSFLVTAEPTFLAPLVISASFLVMGLINKSRENIKIYEDHLEMKFAPASPLHLIRYEDLIRLEDKGKNQKRLYFLSEGKEKKILIPLSQHPKEDMDEFVNFLEEKIQSKKSN